MWDYRRWEFCAGKSDRSSKGQLTGRLSGRREQDLWGAFPQMSSSSHFEYYANTKEFYKSLATQSSLSASLQSAYSLGATVTVSVATKSKSSQQSEVKILGEVLYCSGKIWLPRNNVCEARNALSKVEKGKRITSRQTERRRLNWLTNSRMKQMNFQRLFSTPSGRSGPSIRVALNRDLLLISKPQTWSTITLGSWIMVVHT